jgi:hypothetical protein
VDNVDVRAELTRQPHHHLHRCRLATGGRDAR